MDLISVIIPVYNHDEHLSEVLASVVCQSYKYLEVIIVDDGSRVPLSSNYKNISSEIPIKLVRQENKGAPAARNTGLKYANGEYVIFWDADVVASSQMLEKMYNALINNNDCSFAYCNSIFGFKKMPSAPFDLEKLKQNNYIHSTSLIKKSDCPLWDESLQRFQDWDLWLTMAKQGKKGIFVDEYLYSVYVHKGGISGWLPSFAYKWPWNQLPIIKPRVAAFERSRNIIVAKHCLNG